MEIQVIDLYVRKNLDIVQSGANIYVCTDSADGLKTLATHSFESILVWEYRMNVSQLATKKRVSLMEVLGYAHIKGYDIAAERQAAAFHWTRKNET